MALCFRDMAFCASDCTNTACHRHYGPDDAAAARRWWSHDPDHAPVAFSDFSDRCPDYRAPMTTEGEV
jgi:hypothetical protein